MASTVKVSEIQTEIHFEWRIEDFFSLPTDKPFQSAPISFAGASWVFCTLPNGNSMQNSKGFVGLFLIKITHSLLIPLEIAFGVTTSKGKMQRKFRSSHKVIFHHQNVWGTHFYISRVELLIRRFEMVPYDILTVDWTIKFPETTVNARFAKLSNDLEVLMKSGDRSDTTVKVKGVEFRLHRNILKVRNPVFNKMFESEMRENITGIVSIDDCEPDIFRLLVHFLYTGKVEELSVENVCALYEVANMYQEDQLKKECSQFMLNSISVDSFCDYVVVGMRYDDRELFKKVTGFFASNSKEIFRTDQWLTLMREYTDYANVILINHSEPHQNSSLLFVLNTA